MPDVDRHTFAAMCATTYASITTNINRGKLMLLDNGLIDTDNPLNNSFMKRYQKNAEKKKLNQKKQTEKIYNEVVEKAESDVKTKAKKKTSRVRKKQNDFAEELSSWDSRKKKADALLQERKAELELLKVEKMNGKLVPVDLVFKILRIHNQSIFSTFQSELENMAGKFCDILAAGDRKRLAEINESLSHSLNLCVNKASEVAELDIDNTIDEYAETRNRGERK